MTNPIQLHINDLLLDLQKVRMLVAFGFSQRKRSMSFLQTQSTVASNGKKDDVLFDS